jgi:protein-tyrosine phosphatase
MSGSAHKSRIIPLQGALPIRDLGGYRSATGRLTRWNRIFRSGAIHSLTRADRGRVAELKIRTVVDLRSNSERQEHPHGLLAQPELLYWAGDYADVAGDLTKMLTDPSFSLYQARAAMIDLYRDLPYELAAIYRQLFLHTSSSPLPLLFNCAAGKDRTGVAAALLLSAVGVDWEDVIADYLVTQMVVPRIIQTLERSKSGQAVQRLSPQIVASLVGVDRLYLDAMHESVVTRSGSMEGYLSSELKLDADVLRRIRDRILD